MKRHTHASKLLDDFFHLYNKRDKASILKLFTKNANVWGTGIDEYRNGLDEIEEQLERDWSQSDICEATLSSSIESSADNTTWARAVFTVNLVIDGVSQTIEHLRMTVIAKQENDIWKIDHMHASFPDKTQDVGQSFPT